MADNSEIDPRQTGSSPILPLPEEVNISHDDDLPADQKAAADLVRKKLAGLYEAAPQPNGDQPIEQELAAAEAQAATRVKLSKHQQFIYDLAASGRPATDIKTAWHQYYAELSDQEKHQVWQEFNEAHKKASKLLKATGSTSTDIAEPQMSKPRRRPPSKLEQTARHHAKTVITKTAAKIPAHHRRPLKSAAFGLAVGLAVIFVVMFTFFNEKLIAPFIQPSRQLTNSQIIIPNGKVPAQPEIIIPKINVEIPVIYYVRSTDEKAVQKALESGVVRYGNSPDPGQNGNVVIIGHSASNIFNRGKYKFAFSLLRRLNSGDTFYLNKGGIRYTYQVYKKLVVNPDQVEVLGSADKPAVASLITCDPPGSNAKRLVVVGKQIDPNPKLNHRVSADAKPVATNIVPSNAPSLWSRLVQWFTD